MALTVGSIFSGIGGLDLGLERAGMRVIWQSEIEPYCVKVLAKHWPALPNLGDVTAIDWSEVERPDVICGGYPCQPFSLAGVRRGEADPRHLWPHMLTAIRYLRPRFALLENVPGHRSLGFGTVLGDLAESGYDAEWESVTAAFVGAPHLRDRVFIAAYPNSESESGRPVDAFARRWQLVPDTSSFDGERAEPSGDRCQRPETATGNDGACLADADGSSRNGTRPASQTLLRPSPFERLGRCGSGEWGTWAAEPDVGRVAYGVPDRLDRLRGLGNAVVPQVAEFIGRQLMAAL